MEDVIQIVERIRLLPGAFVDSSIAQGLDDDDMTDEILQSIDDISSIVEPYILPDDYLFFLKYYGGLHIQQDNHRLQILGFGPKVNEHYEDVIEENTDSSPNKDLYIGDISYSEKSSTHYVGFILDVAGVIQKYSIISLGPNNVSSPHPFSLREDDLREWKIVASSFTEWLGLIVNTQGRLGY